MVTTNGQYLRTLPGMSRMVGLALLIISISFAGHSYEKSVYNLGYKLDSVMHFFPSGFGDWPGLAREQFHLAVTGLVFTISVISLVFYVMNNTGPEYERSLQILDLGFHGLAALLLIIGGSLLIASAGSIEGACKRLDGSVTTTTTTTTTTPIPPNMTTTPGFTIETTTNDWSSPVTMETTVVTEMSTTTTMATTTGEEGEPSSTPNPTTPDPTTLPPTTEDPKSPPPVTTSLTSRHIDMATHFYRMERLLKRGFNPENFLMADDDDDDEPTNFKCQYRGGKQVAGSISIITSLLYGFIAVVLFLRRNAVPEPGSASGGGAVTMHEVGL